VKIESMPTTPRTSSDETKSERRGSVEDSEGALSTDRSTPVKSVDAETTEGTPRSARGLPFAGLCLSHVILHEARIL
jgi:hypothetical protein